jgi:hypothetical protein
MYRNNDTLSNYSTWTLRTSYRVLFVLYVKKKLTSLVAYYLGLDATQSGGILVNRSPLGFIR